MQWVATLAEVGSLKEFLTSLGATLSLGNSRRGAYVPHSAPVSDFYRALSTAFGNSTSITGTVHHWE